MNRTLLFTVLLTGSLSGCGVFVRPPSAPDAGRPDSGAPFDGGTRVDGGVNLAELCRAMNLNRCAHLIQCGLIADAPASLEACVRELEATWCGPQTWPPHVAAGALRLDTAKAEACATAFATWSCDEFASLPDSCNTFLKPRAVLGENCYDGFTECAEGVCRGLICPRTCQARAFGDAPCMSDLECRSNLFCKFSPFSPASGVCTPFGANGAACEADRECLLGLHCVNNQCRLLPGAGDACLFGRCTETAFCDRANADGGVCVLRKGETAPCSGDECQPVLLCDVVDSKCVRVEVGSGDPCTPGQRCPLNEVCVGATTRTGGTCGAPLAPGSACVSHADCEAHLACLAGDGGATCEHRLPAGSACESDRECYVSARCINRECVETSLPAQACSSTQPCRWGLCREDVSGVDGGVCGMLLPAGLGCRSGAQCASGLCDNGTCLGRCLP